MWKLGGLLPIDAQEFIKMSGCEFLQLPSPKRTDLTEILQKCLKADQGALVNWNRLCNLTIGKRSCHLWPRQGYFERRDWTWIMVFRATYMKDNLDIWEENIPVNDLIHRNILNH